MFSGSAGNSYSIRPASSLYPQLFLLAGCEAAHSSQLEALLTGIHIYYTAYAVIEISIKGLKGLAFRLYKLIQLLYSRSMRIHFLSIATFLSLVTYVTAIPAWGSLAGLSEDEIELFIRTVPVTGALPPPLPNPNTSSFLVNDADHPYQAPGPDDIRGPCPGLNTLASHGVSQFLIVLACISDNF